MAQYNQLNCFVDNDSDQDTLYTEWMSQVEYIVYESLEMYLDDLPDENYRINFDEGMCPEEMAQIVINSSLPIENMIEETVYNFCN
jgi:hypothetical protein